MNFKKIFLIIGLATLIFVITLNTSFAVSSEKLTVQKSHTITTYTKNIVTIDQIYVENIKINKEYSNVKKYYNVKIKEKYQDKYKIKTIDTTYHIFNKTSKELDGYIYTYYGIYQNNVKFKSPNLSFLDKMTINYYTNSKIKTETTSFHNMNSVYKQTEYFSSKNAKAKIYQIGYNKKNIDVPTTTYHKIKIVMKNKKHKIKKIKGMYYSDKSGDTSITYKGNGKSSLTIISKKKYVKTFIYGIKVYYY